MNERDLRVSDAEREQAASVLAEHYAQGRVTTEEHSERLDRIWAARTRGDLDTVFADLPGPGGPPPSRRSRPSAGPSRPPTYWSGAPACRRRGLPAPFFLVLAALIVLTAVTHVPFVLGAILVAFFVFGRRRTHRV